MHLVSANGFYRRAKKKGPIEDGLAINLQTDMFLVCDGVSGPYSPSNPMQNYGRLTGGQMASNAICNAVAMYDNFTSLLIVAIDAVRQKHELHGKDPSKEAVAGSCFAACQINKQNVELVLAGDCFALCKTSNGFDFYTNFDQAAFEFEQRADEYFQNCMDKCGGDIGKAWDMYYPYFADKQFFRANRNLGKGGHAILNGDGSIGGCLTWVTIEDSLCPEWILLGTDGLLPQSETDPRKRPQLADRLGYLYGTGGIQAILEWRDSCPGQPHIAGWPEASAIEIKLARE